MSRFDHSLVRIADWDRRLTERANRASAYRGVRCCFSVISRLGDGVFWYSLMALLVLTEGAAALRPVLHMIVVGLACTALYKWLKALTSRPRPYCHNERIMLFVAPLDQYSFPSGHTLHAVSFTLLAVYYYPVLAWALIPFACLVALSRLVLGLHYPSDVLAGMLIGASVASLSISLLG
ncbi:undecaprenyl-diphosphatase [Chitinivorax tropicus]|uniref:Undecaprenyl-diphosphatase n=1 Tax=Chitinivorax tropicus TaxID=714531 RepID=A0A840MKV4_9PROT|nr:phosphatase PAP2 family protein [Chitinivorax tropicus]MBB5018135.1 undecaprenyl-diphosphatase [Chitinivorax tropicus]